MLLPLLLLLSLDLPAKPRKLKQRYRSVVLLEHVTHLNCSVATRMDTWNTFYFCLFFTEFVSFDSVKSIVANQLAPARASVRLDLYSSRLCIRNPIRQAFENWLHHRHHDAIIKS